MSSMVGSFGDGSDWPQEVVLEWTRYRSVSREINGFIAYPDGDRLVWNLQAANLAGEPELILAEVNKNRRPARLRCAPIDAMVGGQICAERIVFTLGEKDPERLRDLLVCTFGRDLGWRDLIEFARAEVFVRDKHMNWGPLHRVVERAGKRFLGR